VKSPKNRVRTAPSEPRSAVAADFFSKLCLDSYAQLHGESEYLVLDLNRNEVLAKKLKK
jgi:hypothetical protein